MTADRDRLRRRLLALIGLWLFLAGLLSALSFVTFVLVASAVLLAGALAAGGLLLLKRLPMRSAWRAASDSTGRAARGAGAGVRATGRGAGAGVRALDLPKRTRRAGVKAGALAAATPGRTRLLVDRGSQMYAAGFYRVSVLTGKALRQDPGRQALRFNERGAQLRREGNPGRAAEQHRVALRILRGLGDQHAEALTLNNLALALAQGGADAAAVQHFEQALGVLQALGDEEHEAQVIANLGVVRSRQGRSEEAVSLLHEALDKLPPESPAYRQVEAQLQRAS
jgi:Flp pilus assembly protein TadD